MHILQKYRIPLLITMPFVVLVLVWNTGTNHFSTDAAKHAGPTYTRKNLISQGMADQMEGRKLQINLEKDVIKHKISGAEILTIEPQNILSKPIIRKLLKNDGPVFLSSSDFTLSVRIWMILSQMGISDLYILSENDAPEELKYEFRAGTTASPESI